MLLRKCLYLIRSVVLLLWSSAVVAQSGTELTILTGTQLGNGLAINLNTSDNRTDWLSNDGSSLIMRYPGGQSTFGVVFITVGPAVPPGNRPSQDISPYQTIVLDMRGDAGSSVGIGIKDSTQQDDGSEIKVPVTLSGDWQTNSISLSRFSRVDLTHAYVLAEFVFTGSQSQLLQVRNIRYTSAPALTTKVLPQFAFGGGWYSALYFANTGSTSVSLQLSFIGDDGKPLTIPSVGGSSMVLNLAPRGSAFVDAPNAGLLTQGYVAAVLPDGVIGYGVFRQTVPGQPDQEAVVPLSAVSASTSTLIWDDTNYVTAVAIVNTSATSEVVNMVIRDGSGQTIGAASLPIPAKGKASMALRNMPGLAAMVGKRGTVEFSVTGGTLAVLGLRFNGAAFTSIATY